MDIPPDELIRLIALCLQGEATPTEHAQLARWRAETPDNAATWALYERIWQSRARPERTTAPIFDGEAALSRLWKKVR